jgi:hypothetical protein
VIWDSEPWRNHLLASARALAKHGKTTTVTDHTSVLVERAVFFGAYVMRKLDDSYKLSTSWRGTALKCKRFPPTSRRRPSLIDWHHIDRHFDLSKPQPDSISARDYCDLVVHSFAFVEMMNDDGSIEGFYITSDKLRGKGIWQFGLNTVIDLMKKTAKDWPTFARTIRDPETGETMVWAGNTEPPEERARKADKFVHEIRSRWPSKAR